MAQAYNWLLAAWIQNVKSTGCSDPDMTIIGDVNRADILHRAARHFVPIAAFGPENAIRARRHNKVALCRNRTNRNLRKTRHRLDLVTGNHPQAARRTHPDCAVGIDANTMTTANRIRAVRFYPRGTHQHTWTYFGRNPWLTGFVEDNRTDIVFIRARKRPRLVVLLPVRLIRHRDWFCVGLCCYSHVRSPSIVATLSLSEGLNYLFVSDLKT